MSHAQVETISDQYMLVSGAPSACRFHANYIAEVALAFRAAADAIADPSHPGDSLKLQLGAPAPLAHTRALCTSVSQ